MHGGKNSKFDILHIIHRSALASYILRKRDSIYVKDSYHLLVTSSSSDGDLKKFEKKICFYFAIFHNKMQKNIIFSSHRHMEKKDMVTI